MFDKLKEKLFQGVIVRKVAQKFAKHAVGALIGLLASGKIASSIAQFGLEIDYTQLEAGLVVAITGGFGALYNYIQHRFIKKPA